MIEDTSHHLHSTIESAPTGLAFILQKYKNYKIIKLYLGRITSDIINYKPKEYKGICSTVFKEHYRNHKAFNNERYRMDTELSKEVWAVKNKKNGTPKISWSIFRRFPPYYLESKRCYFCLNEKLEIAIHKEDNLLKRRCKVISKCRHQNKYKLSNLTPFSCNDNIT